MVPNAGKPCIRLSISELCTLACSAIMLLLKPARDIPTDCQLFTIINFCLNDTFFSNNIMAEQARVHNSEIDNLMQGLPALGTIVEHL
jgi:hypothetical protein